MAKAADLSTGSYIKFNGELCQIIEYTHRTPGNLRAFYQGKMRNIRTGKLAEHRFRPDEEVEEVRVEERNLQYLYKDGSDLVCMDANTFEQYPVNESLFGEAIHFIKEGSEVIVGFDGETPVLARPPKVVELEVAYTEPGVRGDTATKTLKPATLETGARISVPLFINQGEKIRVNTETGEYLERVKD